MKNTICGVLAGGLMNFGQMSATADLQLSIKTNN
jgi:hypothetical protein